MVRYPVTTQAPISNTGESTKREISAETIKMPEPIMEPITSVVALVRPSPLTNSLSPEARDTVFSSVANEPLSGLDVAGKNLHQQSQEFCSNFGGRAQQVGNHCDRIDSRIN